MIDALGDLREAAPLFHRDDSATACTFVEALVRRMLHGGGRSKPLRVKIGGQLNSGQTALDIGST